jgi:predicted GNAT superfamily acetyltransferase
LRKDDCFTEPVLQSPPGIEITDVTMDVIPTISELAESCALESARTLNQGFLVSGYNIDDYRRFGSEAADFIMAKDETLGVAGFALTLAENAGVLIAQVAVSSSSKRRGIGRRLYTELLRRHLDEEVTAEIVQEPMNVASIAFHEAMGFVFISEIRGPRFRVGRWVHRPGAYSG